MLRARLCSTLVLSLAACSGQARAPAAVPINGEAAGSAANPGARGGDDDAGFPAVPMTASGDAFAALLEERTRALLSAAASGLVHLGERPRRTTIVRVIWQTITSDPVARIEAMAFLLPDGRLRWGVLGALKPSGGIQVASGLAYPQGLLAEGLRRPLAAGEGDCDLPMIPLVDLATLPQVAREDTFLHGYGRADACRLVAELGGRGAWVVSLDWFGVILGTGDAMSFVTAPTTVDGATLTFGAPTVTPMPLGDRIPIVDGAGTPRCDMGADCFAIAERAALTGERPLAIAAYARACDRGHGLSCIHAASFDADPAAADGHRARAVTAFRAGCGGGSALDCAYLGISLETGQGAAQDAKAAVTAYRASCDGGNALGCFNLGGMQREGRGTRKDAGAARVSYQRACDLGDDGGCDAAASTTP